MPGGLERLPERVHALTPARPGYEVTVSAGLQADAREFRRDHRA